VYDELAPPDAECLMVDPADATRRTSYCGSDSYDDLLVPVFEEGDLVYDAPEIESSRARASEQIGRLDPSHVRLLNPHVYKVGMEIGLYERKTALILKARGSAAGR